MRKTTIISESLKKNKKFLIVDLTESRVNAGFWLKGVNFYLSLSNQEN
jgi:hypothetical protein